MSATPRARALEAENARLRRLIDRLTSHDLAGRPFPYHDTRHPEGQGCIWCGAWEEGHDADCPWREARALLER